jgi:nitroreductase
MELWEVLRRRRMVRSFAATPVPADVLDGVLGAALRAPSAGHTQGWRFVVLEGAGQTEPFWDLVSPPAGRAAHPWPGLLRAPVVVLPLASPEPYLERYAEPDKEAFGRDRVEAWPVPYWEVDCSFAVMLLLLAATDAGLGAHFFGLFDPVVEAAVLGRLGVPEAWRPLGVVALGYPDGGDRPSSSARTRPRRTLDEAVHRGRW